MEGENNVVSPNKGNGSKKIIQGVIIGILIGLILIATGFYFWGKFGSEISQTQKGNEQGSQFSSDKNQIPPADQKNKLPGAAENIENPNELLGDAGENEPVCEADWEALTNNDVGYRLCIPKSWTYKITDEKSELMGGIVKYVTITSPDGKYRLHFGLKKKTDSFYTSDRTGVGAGDIQKIGKVTVLGQELNVIALSYENKVHEIFFGEIGSVKLENGKYILDSWFGPTWDTYTGAGMNTAIPEVEAAKKILSSLSILESDEAVCHPLTNEDLLTMQGWKSITNNKYKYTFKYPQEWKVVSNEGDMIGLEDKDKMVSLQFRSGPATEIGYAGYKKISEASLKVDCLDAHATYFKFNVNGDQFDHYMTVVSFKRGDTQHVIMFSYKSMGASLDSDLGEAFGIILKTVNFN